MGSLGQSSLVFWNSAVSKLTSLYVFIIISIPNELGHHSKFQTFSDVSPFDILLFLKTIGTLG